MPFVIGENIGPYRLVEQLGQGGMATVFKAYHPALDRYVAIKALHPALTSEPNFLTRFQREAQVVARLEHPNIVPVYDYSEHEGRPYLVMKFIEGETLKARLKRGALDRVELMQVVESVGAAIGYAHSQGVLHRDVKPSNVLLATDGRIYLADFGLARMAEAGESTISSDVMLGTPQYISPEQASGQRDLDNGTDIYSFGILLYELLVGKVPYIADTPYSIIHDHIYAPLPLPRSIKPEIPEAVERVLLRALAKERADRFSDVASLLEAWRQASIEPAESVAALNALPLVSPMGETGSLAAERTRAAETRVVESDDAPASSAALPAQPLVAEPTGQRPAARRRWPTWVVIGIIFLAVCLCLGAALLSAGVRKRAKQATATAQALPTLAAMTPAPSVEAVDSPYPPLDVYPVESTGAPPLLTPRPLKPLWSLLQSSEVISATGQVEAALAGVQQSPQSASARLDLAIAYAIQGNPTEAQKVFKAATGLAANQVEFYELAGDRVAQREAWALAALMYLEALDRTTGPTPPVLSDKINQALYLAADTPEIQAMLGKAPADRLSPGIVEATRARSAIYRGDTVFVRNAIRRLKTQFPDNSLIQLLNADLSFQSGDLEQAKAILTSLIGDSKAPLWAHRVAEYLLNKAKN